MSTGTAAAGPRAEEDDAAAGSALADDALRLAVDLVRIDTTNTGEPDTTVGERVAAERVAALLAGAGLDPVLLEPEPRRTSVIARWPGTDPAAGALLVHAHLDVVPAVAGDWTVHPFAGEVRDGLLWGRGTVDMKHQAATTLAAVRSLVAAGVRPRRDVVLAFLADEECGGLLGARWLVEAHRDLFDGVTDAIGEVGGFSVPLPGGRRAFLVETEEKGAGLLRLRATGTAGHGSAPPPDHAVARLAEAVLRLQRHRFPTVVDGAATGLLAGVERLTGRSIDPDGPVPPGLEQLARIARLATHDTVSVNLVRAGYKTNVVPGEVTAVADCRILPGREEAFTAEIAAVLDGLDGVTWDLRTLPGFRTEGADALLADVTAALRAHEPDAEVLPYLMPASTDAKAFHGLGIRCLGFTPARFPADLDYLALFHAVDERIPVDALTFGARTMRTLLAPSP